MAGFGFVIQVQDMASAKLVKLADMAKRPIKASTAAASWLTGHTMKVFETGGHDGEWEPLSKLTLFIRAHRARMPRQSDRPMNDTGRLKGSFMPIVADDGSAFGAGTNVDYAQLMQTGGTSLANSVAIAGFKRRRPGAKVGYVAGRKRYTGGGPVSVRDYIMRIKEGHAVPARPFFPPPGVSGLESWGYLDQIRAIFAMEFGT